MSENTKLGEINIAEGDDVHQVTKTITDALSEKNIPVFTRIVEGIGNDKAKQLYYMTVDVESAGGKLINNGKRRRTPGGVYISLLKSDPSIPAPIISDIFEQEDKVWSERKKCLEKIHNTAREKWKKPESKWLGPETLTPTEVLDNNNEVEVDVSDRPDTPEPKDSSDNESKVENEEEEEETDEMAESESKIEDANCDGVVNENVEMS